MKPLVETYVSVPPCLRVDLVPCALCPPYARRSRSPLVVLSSRHHFRRRSMNKGLGASMFLAVGAMMSLFSQGIVGAQKASPSDLPAKLSGTWVLNHELSTGFRAAAPGRRGGGAGPLFAVAGLAGQRGGRGGGGGVSDASDLTPQ